MKKINNYICWGLLLNAIYILSIRFNLLHDFIEGVIIGVALLFMLMGMCCERYDVSKIQNYKKNLLSRIVTK